MIKIESITMQRSPYLVEPHEKPQQAIKYAIEKGLLKKFNINKKLVNDYLNSKKEIPIWILEAACNINKNYIEIPIKYQYLWFCLSKVRIKRRLNEKKILTPKVDFFTVYVEPTDKVIKLIEKALVKIGTKTELGKLCCVKRQTIHQWIIKQTKPSLMGLLKICQIINKNINIWEIIDNHKLYSYNCSNDDFLLFKNYPENKIIDILTWIKLEGHLNINRSFTETNQKDKDIKVIKILKEQIKKLYQIKENHFFIYDNSIKKGTIKDWSGFKLSIASAPLRQILCLRYNIPIGYKCSFVELSKEIESCKTREDKYRLISTVIETEGAIIKRSCPIISVTSASKNLIEQLANLLESLEYKPKINTHNTNDYELRISGNNALTRLHFYIYPYFNHPSKKLKFIEILKGQTLTKLRIKNKIKAEKIIKETREITKINKDINKDLANYINQKMENISDYKINRHNINGWINLGKSPTLLPILIMCKLSKRNFFDIIPKYYASSLWANGLFNIKELNKIRGANG